MRNEPSDSRNNAFVLDLETDVVAGPRLGEEPATERVEIIEQTEAAEDEPDRVREAAENFLAGVASSGPQPRNLERARAHLDQVIFVEMNERLQDAQWYLTGVQVGLESLRHLHEVSSLVYRKTEAESVGARKVANLRLVHQQLVEFEQCFRVGADPSRRASILIAHRESFESLLGDLEERDTARDPDLEGLSLFAQVAQDVSRTCNQLRAYENLVGALKRIEQAPRFPPGARAKKVADFVISYGSILSLFDWEGVEHFANASEVQEKQAQVRERIAQVRAHLELIRQAMAQDSAQAGPDGARPERDLDKERIVPILRKLSEHGVAYLKRAYGVYEHTLEHSELVGRLTRSLEALKAAA